MRQWQLAVRALPLMGERAAALCGVLTGLLITCPPVAAQQADCLRYGREVALDGEIVRNDEPANPDIDRTDERVYWLLELPAPICVHADPVASENQAVGSSEALQLALHPEDYTAYRGLLGQPVTVRGELFHAVSAHHAAALLLDSVSVAPRSEESLAFRSFWQTFRQAAADGDCTALADMATPGFEVAGRLDTEPLEFLGRDAVAARCPSWLEADAGLLDRPEEARSFFARAADEPPAIWRITPGIDNQARVGAFAFARSAGQWRWTGYYQQAEENQSP